MEKILKVIEIVTTLVVALLIAIPLVSVIAAQMTLANIVCAGAVSVVFVGMTIFTVKSTL